MNLNERELITQYFNMGLRYVEILLFLSHLHNIFMSMRTLKRRLRALGLYRRKNYSDLDEIVQYLRNQLERSSQLHGYRWMYRKCVKNSFVVKQDTIRQLLQVLDPEGVEFRRRRRLRRRQYKNKGPNYLWHMDSYDKLKPFGIAINGCIDGFSRHIIWLRAGSTNNDPKVIAGYYQCSIKKLGGFPCMIRADMGTENIYVERMQNYLKEVYNKNGIGFIYGKSPANQRIESWWAILRKHQSQFWMNIFQSMRDENIFNGSDLDKSLIQFCFMKIIQDELDEVSMEWNVHSITSSRNSISPSGRPIIMYNLPEVYQMRDYLIYSEEEFIEDCERYCSFPQAIIDMDVYHLCNIIMTENNLRESDDPFEAVNLYITLREKIYDML